MTRDETRKILAVLRTAYPNFYRNVSDSDVTDTLNLWDSMFTDDDPRLVAAAVKSIIVANWQHHLNNRKEIWCIFQCLQNPQAVLHPESAAVTFSRNPMELYI